MLQISAYFTKSFSLKKSRNIFVANIWRCSSVISIVFHQSVIKDPFMSFSSHCFQSPNEDTPKRCQNVGIKSLLTARQKYDWNYATYYICQCLATQEFIREHMKRCQCFHSNMWSAAVWQRDVYNVHWSLGYKGCFQRKLWGMLHTLLATPREPMPNLQPNSRQQAVDGKYVVRAITSHPGMAIPHHQQQPRYFIHSWAVWGVR